MDAAQIAHALLRRWADAIAARDVDALAQMFDENAVFIATAPAPLQGRAAIGDYYRAAPNGLRAQAQLLVAVLSPLGISIVADVVFDVPAKGALNGRLSLACSREGQIGLYHMAPRTAQP